MVASNGGTRTVSWTVPNTRVAEGQLDAAAVLDQLKEHLVTLQKPYLNAGCGRIILPSARPSHHAAIDPAIYDYPLWVNVDRNAGPGVDKVMDLFRYPWDIPDNSFDGALVSHVAEHIPHEIRLQFPDAAHVTERTEDGQFVRITTTPDDYLGRAGQLQRCQDGWYAWWAEMWRVLTPGAIVHVLSPYAWSQGAITDPSHTRYLTEHTFSHSMAPDPNSPFEYNTAGLHFEMVGAVGFTLYPAWTHLVPAPGDDEGTAASKGVLLTEALRRHINVAMEISLKLRAVK